MLKYDFTLPPNRIGLVEGEKPAPGPVKVVRPSRPSESGLAARFQAGCHIPRSKQIMRIDAKWIKVQPVLSDERLEIIRCSKAYPVPACLLQSQRQCKQGLNITP